MSGAIDTSRATSPEVGAALAGGVLAVLPVGALEQHGPHLPLTVDTVLASGVAARIAAEIEGLLLPAIAYGDTWNNESFSGTLSISPDTLRAILIDIGTGLKRMGVNGLVVINGHFGNREPIALAARALDAGHRFPVVHLDYPELERLAAEICESQPAGPGFYHADEVETSMMLALAPESVAMDKAVAEYPAFPPTFGMEPMQLGAFNRSGVFGDPRAASAEKGEKLIAGIVAASVQRIADWRAQQGI